MANSLNPCHQLTCLLHSAGIIYTDAALLFRQIKHSSIDTSFPDLASFEMQRLMVPLLTGLECWASSKGHSRWRFMKLLSGALRLGHNMQVRMAIWVIADNGPERWHTMLTHCSTRRACTHRASQYANMLRLT